MIHRVRSPVHGVAVCIGAILLVVAADRSSAMTADGAVITNYAAATGYWGISGPGYTQRYTVSYNATTGVLISCPVVRITKIVAPTTLAVAQTATYTVCAVNASLNASAWNLVLSDKLPDNMAWAGNTSSWNPPAPTAWTLQVSGNGTTWSGAGLWPPAGQTAPYFMRWTLNVLGPNRSACLSFSMVVL